MAYKIHPLTPALWPQFEDLFGSTGACGGCWCMYWRIGSAYQKTPRETNKASFHAVVCRGPPPGLLAFDGELPVGWCQLTPRDQLPALERARLLARIDEKPVWSISCFFVRRGYRNQGVTAALIAAALKTARRAKAAALEAYPVDTTEKKSSTSIYTGKASTFRRAGFKVVARRVPHRPLMRHDLKQL
jgi:GNAT superfamily N-acetyltransferase